jgi:hypothetical protein
LSNAVSVIPVDPDPFLPSKNESILPPSTSRYRAELTFVLLASECGWLTLTFVP